MEHASKMLIEDILLCDPITERGRKCLKRLKLDSTIGPNEFFSGNNKLWIDPICDDLNKPTTQDPFLVYSSELIEKNDIITRRQTFKNRFDGYDSNHLTVLMGVVGSGKSIDIQHQVYDKYQAIPFRCNYRDYSNPNKALNYTPNSILLDIEEIDPEVTKGCRYSCPDFNSPLWLFCTKLLSTLIEYIHFLHKNYNEELKASYNNLNAFFIDEENGVIDIDEQTKRLFSVISKYANGIKGCNLTYVFKTILTLMLSNPSKPDKSSDSAEVDTEFLLRILSLLMFCSFPYSSKTLLIDNIEDYIAITGCKERLLVSNEQVQSIYNILKKHSSSAGKKMNRAKPAHSKGGKGISVILAIRRTSWAILDDQFNGTNEPYYGDIFDVTGDVSLLTLWETKKKNIWDLYLKNNYDVSSQQYVQFVDELFHENDKGIGTGFQELFSRLMSRGLRRMGHGESKIFYTMYFGDKSGLCNDTNPDYINYSEYTKIMSLPFGERSASKYILRQAMIELYFKDQMLKTGIKGNIVGERWRHLNLGHIDGLKSGPMYAVKGFQNGSNIPFSKIRYDDAETFNGHIYRSLLHRILSILSNNPDLQASACIAPMFLTVPIYMVMEKLLKPSKLFSGDTQTAMKRYDEMESYRALAKVILASSIPDREGDYSPLTLLHPHNDKSFDYRNIDAFAAMLKAIWKNGLNNSISNDDHLSNNQNFGIRLSESGCEFLLNWHPSFAFFSSLYNCNLPPLFFIKSPQLIKHILGKVYDYANRVCRVYEEEASSFFSIEKASLINDTLPMVRKQKWTFRKLVQKLHTTYLDEYKNYISKAGQTLGISDTDKETIMRDIEFITDKYRGKTGTKDEREDWRCERICF